MPNLLDTTIFAGLSQIAKAPLRLMWYNEGNALGAVTPTPVRHTTTPWDYVRAANAMGTCGTRHRCVVCESGQRHGGLWDTASLCVYVRTSNYLVMCGRPTLWC